MMCKYKKPLGAAIFPWIVQVPAKEETAKSHSKINPQKKDLEKTKIIEQS